MSYVTQRQATRPAALIGAIGIPAAFAGLLAVGLAVNDVIREEYSGPLPTTEYKDPPPPDPIEPTRQQDPTESVITAPRPDIALPTRPSDSIVPEPDFTSSTTGPIAGTLPPIDMGPIQPSPIPPVGFDPVAAKPANNPGRWVTDSDYRSRWVREGMSGTARFSLEVSAAGKVTNCSITRSTGHPQLDAATCRLIAKRAHFDPALDSTGAPVAGTYASAINWQLPD